MNKKSFKPELQSVCKIQKFVRACLEKQTKDEKKKSDIDLIIDEIVVNIVKYGFEDPSTGFIKVEVEPVEKRIVLVISDNGVAFNPLKAPIPNIHAPLEHRKPGGLGIFLVRLKSKKFHYSRKNNQNRLCLTIDL